MGAFVLPVVCRRCGSQDVHWLGETRASVFVRCNCCKDVWRLDPLVDRDWIAAQRQGRSDLQVASAGHA